MAPWSHIVASNPQVNRICNYTLFILAIAALTEGRSETNSSSLLPPGGHDSTLIFEHFQQLLSRFLSHVSNVARQEFTRKLAGQIGLWEMVYFGTGCGLAQLIFNWKKRREARQKTFIPSSGSIVGGQHGREKTRASLDDNEVSKRGEYRYLSKGS